MIGIKVPKPEKGRRFVVSDIHGCARTFKTLVWGKISLEKTDQLFLLGDYIDRGPDSQGVLNFILKMQHNGYRVFPLRGNHEQSLCELAEDQEHFLIWHLRKQNALNLQKNGKIKAKYLDFVKKLPYYYVLDDFLLVHAGFDFRKHRPFEDVVAMLNFRANSDELARKITSKTIVHGHQVKPLSEIRESIARRRQFIGLDNGAVYTRKHKIYDHTTLGRLCALNLDSFELIVQKNIDLSPENNT